MYRYRNVPRLPVIDLSLYELGDPWRDHVAAQLDWAASEFGAFCVIGHGLDPAFIAAVTEASRSFVRMIEARRARSPAVRGVLEGYLKFEGDPRRSDLLAEVPEFGQMLAEYVQGLTGLAHQLIGLLGRALRVGPDYFADQVSARAARELHLLGPGTSGDEYCANGALRTGGLLTLTHQAQLSGLEVEHPTGWIVVPDVRDGIFVSVDESLEWLTRGRYSAATQRLRSESAASDVLLSLAFKLPHGRALEPTEGVGTQARTAPAVLSQYLRSAVTIGTVLTCGSGAVHAGEELIEKGGCIACHRVMRS